MTQHVGRWEAPGEECLVSRGWVRDEEEGEYVDQGRGAVLHTRCLCKKVNEAEI